MEWTGHAQRSCPRLVAVATCALIWGTTWYAIRVCVEGFPALPSAAIRFTLAAAIMVAIWAAGFARPRPRGPVWGWLVLAGILNAVGYSLVYVGEESVSGGVAAVLFGTEPLVVALLVTITRTERVHYSQIAGGVVALVGVLLIFAERVVLESEQALGIALIACAVPVSALYGLIVKRHTADVHPLASAMVFMIATAVALWAIVLLHGWEPLPWPPPVNPSLALLYLAVFGSVIAFTAYFYCLQQLSLMSSTMLVFVLPVIALAVDVMWEDRFRMTTDTYLGVAIVLLGVAIALRLWVLVPARTAPVMPVADSVAEPDYSVMSSQNEA